MSRAGLQRVSIVVAAGWMSQPLFAAGGGESETFLGLPRWLWLWANLILFLGILYKFAGGPILGFLESRGKEIAAGLSNAESQRREAAEMKATLERQIAELTGEMDRLIARARADGEKERQQILAQAERERERLLTQAEEEIRMRTTQAKGELTRFTASLAAELARRQIEGAIGPDDVDRLFDESLDRLEKVSS